MRWNEAVLEARWGWVESLPEDLAQLEPEEWDGVVREAEKRWSKVMELKSEVAQWYETTADAAKEGGEDEELVFFAGDPSRFSGL